MTQKDKDKEARFHCIEIQTNRVIVSHTPPASICFKKMKQLHLQGSRQTDTKGRERGGFGVSDTVTKQTGIKKMTQCTESDCRSGPSRGIPSDTPSVLSRKQLDHDSKDKKILSLLNGTLDKEVA